MKAFTFLLLSSLMIASHLYGCAETTESNPSAHATGGGGGAGGSTSDPVACDILEIWKGGATACEIGTQCFYDTECTGGGETRFTFTCERLEDDSYNWRFHSFSCENPFESCHYAPSVNSSSVLCNAGKWDFGADGSEEGDWLSCPRERPGETDSCDEDYSTDCGYSCPTGGWVVHECVAQGHTDVPTHWSSNGICEDESSGGAGGGG